MSDGPPRAALLFAAGFGTRMGTLTAERPKPLLEVAGRALLDHALALVDAAGLAPVAVNAHYRAEQIAAHLAHRPDVAISHETPDILDTGGGLRHALPLLGAGSVFTLNTDAVWTGLNPLDTLARAWDGTRMDALLLLVPPDRAYAHAGPGDFRRGPDGRLARGPGMTFTGAQIIRTAPLATCPAGAFSLNAVWDGIAARGRLFGVAHPGLWCDVGHPEGLAAAERMLAEVP